MLSSPRLTGFDLMLATLIVICILRLLAPDVRAAAHDSVADPLGERAEVEALIQPLPSPSDAANTSALARLDLAMRCIALADLTQQTTCRYDGADACWQAREHAALLEHTLWPKGRPGRLGLAFRGQINVYADAYLRLAQQNNHTSQLIRRRDDAMCRGYQAYFEAPPYERKDRQPRRTVQEGFGRRNTGVGERG